MTIECSQSVHSIVATKKSLSKNQRTAFAQALFCRNIPASQVCPFPRRHDKKATLKTQSSFSMFLIQLSSFNPAGLQAACANVHSPCTTVDFTFNASDVGIPDTVGSSMGMAYVVTEMPLPQISHFAMIAPPQTIFVV